MSSTSEKLKEILSGHSLDNRTPVWAGPESKESNGGITFSLLSRYLCCKERFRCLVIDGLRVTDSFNHRLEYGNMWHLCEEDQNEDWQTKLIQYCTKLIDKYRFNQEEIDKWYEVCKLQFPIYKAFWQEREKKDNVSVVMTEQVFHVPYTLPSGRVVYLRGKWDELQVRDGKLYLKENKTKGDIEELKIGSQLKFDLQTMIYMIALEEYIKNID